MKLIDKFNQVIQKIGVDKLLHFFVGFIFAFIYMNCTVLGLTISENSQTRKIITLCVSFVITGVLTFVAAVIKEIVDQNPDRKDILATMIGWFAAYFCSIIIYVAFQ